MDRSQGTFYDHNVQKQKVGVSSMKIFDGEDLTAGDRKRIQALQQKDWIEQQIREKQERLKAEKEAEKNFAQQTLLFNDMRKNLEEDYNGKKKTVQKACMEANRTLAQEKLDKDKAALEREDLDKQNHIDYNTKNDFYTENTATCQSQLAGHRVIPYHWKGMTEHQRQEILHEQDKQKKQTENIKKMQQNEEKMYALQAEHQRKMQIQMEREKTRRKEEVLKNQQAFNLLKNEEQQIKIKTIRSIDNFKYNSSQQSTERDTSSSSSMKHTKTLSYAPSPYSKNSPALKLKIDFKKNSMNDETPTASKQNQDISIRLQFPQNGQHVLDKKSNPLTHERKIDHTTNFYQLSKILDKEQTYMKMQKAKEMESKKITKQSATGNRPQDKFLKERLPFNQQILEKSKKIEDAKATMNLSNQVTSRKTVRKGSIVQNENVESVINKLNDSNMISTKRFKGTVIDLAQFKPNTQKATPSHSKNPSMAGIKKTSKPSSSKGTRQLNVFKPTPDNLSFQQESFVDYAKTPDPRKFEKEKSSNAKVYLNDALASKLQLALKGIQNAPQNSRHRRGLSSGQAPIFIEQHLAQLQEKIKPIELVPADPQHEQEEFFENFFHSDQMTFDFEKMMILQRTKSQNVSASATPTPTNNKQGMHVRTRSIEDPNSILPTKASSRWNTKRSSMGDDNQMTGKETSSLIEQVSDLDKTEGDKEERRKHLRG